MKFSRRAMNYYETGYVAKDLSSYSEVVEKLNLSGYFDRKIFYPFIWTGKFGEEFGLCVKDDSPQPVKTIIQAFVENGYLVKSYGL